MENAASIIGIIADVLSYLNPRAHGAPLEWMGWAIYGVLLLGVGSILAPIGAEILGGVGALAGALFAFMGVTGFVWVITAGGSVESFLLLIGGVIRIGDGFGLGYPARGSILDGNPLLSFSGAAVALYVFIVFSTANIESYNGLEWFLFLASIPACFMSTLGVNTFLVQHIEDISFNPMPLVLGFSLFVVFSYLVSPDLLNDEERLAFFLALPLGVLFGVMARRDEGRSYY
jgi:hypothetical protein